MKKICAFILAFILLSMQASAETMDGIIPDTSIWGVSRDTLKKNTKAKYKTIEIGKTKVLSRIAINVDDLEMDAYYVFDYRTWDATGYTYKGLSKIVYLLSDNTGFEPELLREIKQKFINDMTECIGPPDRIEKAVTTWNRDNTKIEIGIGRFKKYTECNHKNVAIVFSGIEIIKPETPPPTPKPTPKYTYIPPTKKPKQTPKPKQSSQSTTGDLLPASVCLDIASAFIKSNYPGYSFVADPVVDVYADDYKAYVGFSLYSTTYGPMIKAITIDRRSGKIVNVLP